MPTCFANRSMSSSWYTPAGMRFSSGLRELRQARASVEMLEVHLRCELLDQVLGQRQCAAESRLEGFAAFLPDE